MDKIVKKALKSASIIIGCAIIASIGMVLIIDYKSYLLGGILFSFGAGIFIKYDRSERIRMDKIWNPEK